MGIQILDCTIRDGGHLNKWHFSPECVKASYFSALKSGVDFFEVGYRFPHTFEGLGDFAYCADEFLFSLLPVSEKCKLTVMIDAGKSASSLFSECIPQNTPVQAVRVAAYPYELQKAIGLLGDLHSKGYRVFLNLMASSELTEIEFDILRKWDFKQILEAVVFADSFGAFIPSDIPKYVRILRDLGFKNIGFHPHNNLQMSFANTLRAIEEGVNYVDASIYGMGRGAGNLPIEILIGYLEKKVESDYNTVPYLEVIDRFYLDLFAQFNWGYKMQSLMSGLKNIHPYYVDDLFGRRNYTIDEVWNVLDIVKDYCPISYSTEKLNHALSERFYRPLTKEMAGEICSGIEDQMKIIPAPDACLASLKKIQGKHNGRSFLIIATGPSIVKYNGQIEKFIEDENCVTVGVNYLAGRFVPDYHMFVSRKRFLRYLSSVHQSSILLIPSFFGEDFVAENYSGIYSYFNVQIVEDDSTLSVDEAQQNLVNLNVGVCAILLAYQMGASRIFAVGMDGYVDEVSGRQVYFYDENDLPERKEVASLRYERFSNELRRTNHFLQDQSVPFSIITPTSHREFYERVF